MCSLKVFEEELTKYKLTDELGIVPGSLVFFELDFFLLSDGTCAIINSVAVETLESPETTYNFEVEDFHTYFVSDSNVLVHNRCGTPDTAPDDFTKLKNGQGWRDKNGNVWKKDMLHKDHWDVSNKKGVKIKEIDFKGNQIWPGGPKNKNKW